MRSSSRRVELVVDLDAPARIDFDTKAEAFLHGLRPMATSAPSRGFGNPVYKKPSSRYTHHLLRPVPRGLCRDDVLRILLLDREKLRA
jgi:hypothetical protein